MVSGLSAVYIILSGSVLIRSLTHPRQVFSNRKLVQRNINAKVMDFFFTSTNTLGLKIGDILPHRLGI